MIREVPTLAHPRREHAAVVSHRRVERKTLRGFFDLSLPSGLILRGCALHVREDGRPWIGMPARKHVADNGETRWETIVDFADAAARRRFQKAALVALEGVLGVEPQAEQAERPASVLPLFEKVTTHG